MLEPGEIERLEREFPLKAAEAFAEARARALAAGLSVVEAVDGAIYEVFPNGRREFIKRINEPG